MRLRHAGMGWECWGARTSQIRQLDGGEVRGASYWVPHVTQMARSPLSNFMIVGDLGGGSWGWLAMIGMRRPFFASCWSKSGVTLELCHVSTVERQCDWNSKLSILVPIYESLTKHL